MIRFKRFILIIIATEINHIINHRHLSKHLNLISCKIVFNINLVSRINYITYQILLIVFSFFVQIHSTENYLVTVNPSKP